MVHLIIFVYNLTHTLATSLTMELFQSYIDLYLYGSVLLQLPYSVNLFMQIVTIITGESLHSRGWLQIPGPWLKSWPMQVVWVAYLAGNPFEMVEIKNVPT